MSERSRPESALDEEKIELFMSQVVRKELLPNARFSGAFALGSASALKFNYAKVDISNSYSNYLGSKYYFSGAYKFIHYTSVPKLLSIIRDKKIRLYDLRAMDDKDEFDLGYKVLNKESTFKSEVAKTRIFCLSMCKYELEEKEHSLNMWRQFGLDGNGVGIVLKFSKTQKCNWVNFILSQVHYGEKGLLPLRNACSEYSEFSRKYNFKIQNFDEFLYKLFCFHKNRIYRDEKEVRLVYNSGFGIYQTEKSIADLNGKLQKASYRELDLEWDRWKTFTGEHLKFQETVKTIYPYVTIEKVILGYRLSNHAKNDIVETLNAYKTNYRSFPSFSGTPLAKYFHNSKK